MKISDYVLVLYVGLLTALGCWLVFHALRGLKRGKIYLGVRGGREVWGDRRSTPEWFWFGAVACLFVACGLFFLALKAVVRIV